MIDIKVNNKVVNALIDTGAVASLIHPSILSREELKGLREYKGKLSSVTGDKIEIMGKLEVKLEIGENQLIKLIKVWEQCSEDMIMGMDILTDLKSVSIDFSNKDFKTQINTPIKNNVKL